MELMAPVLYQTGYQSLLPQPLPSAHVNYKVYSKFTMGACMSRPLVQRDTFEMNGNTPLQPFKTYISITDHSEAISKRMIFWETQPSYSVYPVNKGRIEIWQTIRLACEAEDLETAQAIVDSAKIKIPTGRFTDGCFDELGNHYIIPDYCVGVIDKPKPSTLRKSVADLQVEEEGILDEANAFKLKLRLSSGNDIEFTVSKNFTISQLQMLIKKQPNWSSKSFMILHFGKTLLPTSTLEEALIDGRTIVQVFLK